MAMRVMFNRMLLAVSAMSAEWLALSGVSA